MKGHLPIGRVLGVPIALNYGAISRPTGFSGSM
jgi:hypothetical protein